MRALEMLGVDIVSLRYPETVVLRDVNWPVEEKDYWAIGGLLGTGKSDLLATAAGLIPVTRGTYRIYGQEIAVGYEQGLIEARLKVGLLFDGGRLLNHLSVIDNVSLPLQYHENLGAAECRDRAATLLEKVGLGDHTSRMPGMINRRLQQRAGLARALALRPKVLLLDNPLSGLDPREALWWLNFLDQLSADGTTLVAAADDLRPWRGRARQFAVLRERRFLPVGSRDELAGHAEPLLRELLHD
jgi:ABC-type transporter Mla maintaining outer membrane lipid asymmetry ATPase subunit MlaF